MIAKLKMITKHMKHHESVEEQNAKTTKPVHNNCVHIQLVT